MVSQNRRKTNTESRKGEVHRMDLLTAATESSMWNRNDSSNQTCFRTSN